MNSTRRRARIAIGAAIVAAAGFVSVGSLAASTTPPPSEPPSSEASALDPEREALVEELITVSAAEDFPLNRDCLSDLVAQIPDADLALVAAELAAPAETAVSVTIEPSAVPIDSGAPATTEPAADVATASTLDATVAMSPEAEALGEQIVYCLEGEADPALVAQVVALFEADEASAEFDMACVASILTTFDDAILQQIIDVAASETEGSGAPDATTIDLADPAFEDAFMLLVCAPDFVTPPVASAPVAETIAAPVPAVETTTG